MKNILLIEPDNVLTSIYTDFFKRSGFSVKLASNAQSAIAVADKKTPDIVILELQLVEHSGIEFLYEFRSYSEWLNTPVIINSQVPKKEFLENWSILTNQLGVVDYLYKPSSSLSALLEAVNQHLTINA